MPNEYTLGFIAKTLVFHLGFRCTFIQRSSEICTKSENSQIEGYLFTKRVIALTAFLSPYILIPFASSVSKSLASEIEMLLWL